MSKIYIGSDHAGFKLKQAIKKFLEKKYKVEDLGPEKYNKNDDYPDYAAKVCNKVKKTKGKGILICKTGQGMCKTANKIKGIYANLSWNVKSAKMSREHGDSNVLCLGSAFVKPDLAKKIVKIWLTTKFTKAKRHIRRINKIKKLE